MLRYKSFKFFSLLSICFFSFFLGSCASIVSKSSRQIVFNSNPSKADIVITDERDMEVFKGETPTTVTLKTGDGYFHGKEYTVKISKEGFNDRIVRITKDLNAWYIAGNCLFGGLIGWLIVDPLTGAMWKLSPENVNVSLEQRNSKEEQTFTICLLEDVPMNLRSSMIRLR